MSTAQANAGISEFDQLKLRIHQKLIGKLDLTRVAGQQAPDEYRKLVREYFKNLSKIK